MAHLEPDIVTSYQHILLLGGTLVKPDQGDTDKQHNSIPIIQASGETKDQSRLSIQPGPAELG